MSVRERIEGIKKFVVEELEKVVAEAEKAVPVVEGVAAAAAAAVPGVAPVAAVVEKVAEGVAFAVGCCAHGLLKHDANGCQVPGCACSAQPQSTDAQSKS